MPALNVKANFILIPMINASKLPLQITAIFLLEKKMHVTDVITYIT